MAVLSVSKLKYGLPKNYKAPVPRWMLGLPSDVERVCIAYVGLQLVSEHEHAQEAKAAAATAIDRWHNDPAHEPVSTEHFNVVKGFDVPNTRVWVSYWTDIAAFEHACLKLDIRQMHTALPNRSLIGLWCERFSVPLERLETNYAGTDYRPGLAQLPDTRLERHDLTAYWGAARDRMPASGTDLFEIPDEAKEVQEDHSPTCENSYVSGTNYENCCHIRSGQWWQNCAEEERDAYEKILEPALMDGMEYLWQHSAETGTLGLRFLCNTDSAGTSRRETCGAGFFRNLSDLENWAKRAPSHLKIFNGALAHAKQFGAERKLRTWHEVVVLKAGEATWEYVNCRGKTGVVGSVKMEESLTLP
ncbi:MAG: hypothetical protein M1828_003789 [Chrysothrix sp. TS-e1954]|nr:MAG: hypothetical protein M1828_003789 [Chrysothrix sp. TS-e1954]